MLSRHERRQLLAVLGDPAVSHVGIAPTKGEDDVEEEEEEEKETAVTRAQLKMLFLVNLFPFVGFGFLDNFVMIIAGEYIDVTIGVFFSISTMAAAALGNMVSDVCGIGMAHNIEAFVLRFGIHAPALTRAQFESSRSRLAVNGGRCLGLILGCLIGMFPLFFFNETDKSERKKKNREKLQHDTESNA